MMFMITFVAMEISNIDIMVKTLDVAGDNHMIPDIQFVARGTSCRQNTDNPPNVVANNCLILLRIFAVLIKLGQNPESRQNVVALQLLTATVLNVILKIPLFHVLT